MEPHELQRFGSARNLILDAARTGSLEINEYVLLRVSENKLMPARHMGDGEFVRLNIPQSLQMPRGIELRPANAGQQCFLDALLDPSISLITCYGQAGTGKTLMAVAAGLFLTAQKNFNGTTVSRPVVAMGDTLGFLPGTLNEKMHPWLQSIYDACEALLPLNPPKSDGNKARASDRKKGHPGESAPHTSQGGGMLRSSLTNSSWSAACWKSRPCVTSGAARFRIASSSSTKPSTLTPLEAKTVVTRMSRGSKLVMVGDPAQIDNPYVDSRSNGLVYTRNRLRGQSITAHISLTKGERSALAELGAKMM